MRAAPAPPACTAPLCRPSGRPARFNAEKILFLQAAYNIVQVLLCGWMVLETVHVYLDNSYSIVGNKYNKLSPPMVRRAAARLGRPSSLRLRAWRQAAVLHVFYLSKILDFFDTVFIITRRKFKQLIPLHVYHHSSIFVVYWLNMRCGYDGDIYYTIIANGFVHFVMYFYYFVTSLNVTIPKPMKKAITTMQRVQFVTMNLQALYIIFAAEADYPVRVAVLYLFYIISLFILFTRFSNKEYGSKQVRSKAE